ncbi:MAG: metallophosphoesterase [Bacteroidales bacterium]|nr:metallophosphoesterase [Bacteroidales bacterium]
MNQLILIIFGLFLSHGTGAYLSQGVTGNKPVNDGPHIYRVNDKLKAEWIQNSVFMEAFIGPENFSKFSRKFNLSFTYDDLIKAFLLRPNHDQKYLNADSIAVISDIHGNYPVYTDLLKVTGIIDDDLNWNFGKGHLVILGDMFDRGDMVTEVLWHLFGLEIQAEKAGGKVHVLLGNHEFMALRNDLCYASPKYARSASYSNKDYADHFSDLSVLGKWLRSKPVIITIDDIMFVHGGISDEMVQQKMDIRKINRIFTEKILGKNLYKINKSESFRLLNGNHGPLWYRGYFHDPGFCENSIDNILDFYGMKHIVVGHTPNVTINSLFGNKVIGADTGICDGRSGEILIYKDGNFFQSLCTGRRNKL